MYNIRIKQLPKTGEQRNYSLVDRNDLYIKVNPLNSDTNVKNTISAVPREEANIEAEGGETVIGDINGDGFLEHNTIVGKRHTQGGVPLNVAPGSFIFSDTKKLKIKDPEILNLFGVSPSKGGVTPAAIAKKYQTNNYMNVLKSDDTDEISKRTASKMLENNLEKLGMLALVQESMKGFPDGIPAIAESVMAGLQGQQSQGQPQQPGQEQGEGVAHEVMEGQEEPGEQEGKMRYGGAYYQRAGIVTQKQKPYIPTNTYKVGPDTSEGYLDRVGDANIFRSSSRDIVDPRMYEATQKLNPFSDRVEGVGDYISNAWSAPQKEMNNLLTGYYESPMDTAARYSEINPTVRFIGDVASDPMMWPEAAYAVSKGAVKLTGKAIKKAVPYAEKVAELTVRYGKQAADFLSQYIGKIPFEQVLAKGSIIASKGLQASTHVGNESSKDGYERIIHAKLNGEDGQIGLKNNKWFDTYTGKEITKFGKYNPIQNVNSMSPMSNIIPLDTTTVEQDRIPEEDNAGIPEMPQTSVSPQQRQVIPSVQQQTPVKSNTTFRPHNLQYTIPSGPHKGKVVDAYASKDTLTYQEPGTDKFVYVPGTFAYGGSLPKHQGTIPGVPSTVQGQPVVVPTHGGTYTNQPSDIMHLPSTPIGTPNMKADPRWIGTKYKTEWEPAVKTALSTPEGAKAVDEYLTSYGGKYGPNILKQLEGLTGQARTDKTLALATDTKPGPFHEAIASAIVPRQPVVPPTPGKKQAFSCVNGVVTTVEYPDNGAIPAGAFANKVDAEAICAPKKDIISSAPEQKKNTPWWIQDSVQYANEMGDSVNKYEPTMQQVDVTTPGYVLKDPAARLAAQKEQAARQQEGLYGSTAGNVAGASMVGVGDKELGASRDIIGDVENQNVDIVNQAAGTNAQIVNQGNLLKGQALQKYIAESATANQQYDNARRDLRNRQTNAFVNGTTNWMAHKQMEDVLFPNVAVNSITGDVTFPHGRAAYDAQGNEVYNPYVNPMSGKSASNKYDASDYFELKKKLKEQYPNASDDDLMQALKLQMTGKYTQESNSQPISKQQMILPTKQSRYGGYIKKYGGVVNEYGALPLYFFED